MLRVGHLPGDGVGELLDTFGEQFGVDQARFDQRGDELAVGSASEAAGDGHGQLRDAPVVDLGEEQDHRIVVVGAIGDLIGAHATFPARRQTDLGEADAVGLHPEVLVLGGVQPEVASIWCAVAPERSLTTARSASSDLVAMRGAGPRPAVLRERPGCPAPGSRGRR